MKSAILILLVLGCGFVVVLLISCLVTTRIYFKNKADENSQAPGPNSQPPGPNSQTPGPNSLKVVEQLACANGQKPYPLSTSCPGYRTASSDFCCDANCTCTHRVGLKTYSIQDNSGNQLALFGCPNGLNGLAPTNTSPSWVPKIPSNAACNLQTMKQYFPNQKYAQTSACTIQ